MTENEMTLGEEEGGYDSDSDAVARAGHLRQIDRVASRNRC